MAYTRAHRVGAELIGTFILVFFAVGSAVFGFTTISPAGVALTFGFLLLALAYTIGPISGCHINPAVTLGILLGKGITGAEAGLYIVAQFVGAILAGGLLKWMIMYGGVTDQSGGLGTNAYGTTVNVWGAFVVELAMTALLVLVVLLTAEVGAGPVSGLAIGLTLGVCVFVGIPLTGTSVNPARSLGPAAWQWSALPQVWLFIVAPLAGAVLGWGIARFLAPPHVVEVTTTTSTT